MKRGRTAGRAFCLVALAATVSAFVGLGARPVVAQKDPQIALKPTSGEPGATVEVTGDSFNGDAKVVIRFAGEDVATGLAVAGSFQLTFTVPQADAGTYKVTACAYNEVECDAGQANAQFEVISDAPTPTKAPAPTPTPTGVVVPPSIVVPPDSPAPLVPWLAAAAGPCADVPFTVGATYSFEDAAVNRSWRVEGQRGEPEAGARSGTFGLGSTYDDFGSVHRPLIVDLGTDMRRQLAVFVGRDAPVEGSGTLTAVLAGYGVDRSGKMVELGRATRDLEEASIPTTRCMYITAPTGLSFRAVTLEYVTVDGESSAERRWMDDLTVGTGRGGFTGGNQTTASFTTPADSSTLTRAPTDPLRVELAIRSLSIDAPTANLQVNGSAGPTLAIRRAPGGDPFTYVAEATITNGLLADQENALGADIFGDGLRRFTATTRFRLVPPIAGNLRVLDVEVNQAIQEPGNRVPLVAGKPTLVRVFVEGTPDSRGAWGSITGQLTTTTADGTRRVHNPLSDTTPHASPISRYTSDSQLLFLLDRNETATGPLRLEVAVQPVASRPQANVADDRFATEVSFVAPVDYRPYGVLFSFPTGETNDWSKLEDFTRYVEAVYPVTTARMLSVPGIGRAPITVETIWWLRYWTGSLLHRLPDGATIFGLWPGTGIPRFECPSPEPSPGASPTPVPSGCLAGLAWFNRTDGYGDPYGGPLVMAQELAHGEGLWWHAESPYEPAGGIGSFLNPAWPWEHASIGHVGVDLRDPTVPQVIPPYRSFRDHTHDFMSYGRGGNGGTWVSPHTYCELLGRLSDGRTVCPEDVQTAPMTREFIGAAPTPRAGGPATLVHAVVPDQRVAAALDHEVEYLSIRGEVAWDAKSATLQPIDSVYRALDLPTMEFGDAFTLEISDGTGNVLRSVPFTPAETHGREGEPVPFELLLARPDGAAHITVKRGDAVLAQVDASANQPVVSLDSGAAQAVLRDGGPLTWTASDADAEDLTYVVEASTDGRQTWWPVAVGLTSPSWTIDPSSLPGSSDAWLRVQASDGFYSSAATVGPFAIADHAPSISLPDLTDGITVAQGRPLMLRAIAHDTDDVSLADGAVVWSSDRDGELGTGEWVVTERLSAGEHQITATVTDSDGQTASASVRAKVTAGGSPVISSPSATSNPATPTATGDSPRPTASPGVPAVSVQSDLLPVVVLAGLAAVGLIAAGALLYRRRK